MDTSSNEKHEIRREYKLPIVCQKARLYTSIHVIGAGLLYVFAIGFTIFWLIARSVGLGIGIDSFVICFWSWPTMMLFFIIYVEPNLVLTEDGIVIKFIFNLSFG